MKSAIDSAGRLVIPKRIRQEANLKAGDILEVEWQEGRIEIQPAPLAVELIRRGRLVVAVPKEQIHPLTRETVESSRQSLRRERAGKS